MQKKLLCTVSRILENSCRKFTLTNIRYATKWSKDSGIAKISLTTTPHLPILAHFRIWRQKCANATRDSD